MRADLGQAATTAQGHADFELFAQHADQMRHAKRPRHGQCVNIRTPDQDRVGAQGEGGEDVAAAPDPAIEQERKIGPQAPISTDFESSLLPLVNLLKSA